MKYRYIVEKAAVIFIGIVAFFLLSEFSLCITGLIYSATINKRALILRDNNEYTIVCLGDSFTVGTGAPAGQDYPSQLEGKLNAIYGIEKFKVINLGIGGGNTTQMLNELIKTLKNIKPNLVIFLGGGSNYWNYLGYHDYLEENTLLSKVNDYLYRTRTYKLARLLFLDIKNKIKNKITYFLVPNTKANNKGFKNNKNTKKSILTDAAIYCKKGWYYNNIKQYDKAIKWFKEGLEVDPNKIGCYYDNIGHLYRRQGQYDEAIKWFKEGIKINPRNSCYYAGIGWSCRDLKQYDKAIKWLKQGIKVNPKDGDCYAHISQVYKEKGDIERALFYNKIAIKLNPKKIAQCYEYHIFYDRVFKEKKEDIAKFLNELRKSKASIPKAMIDLSDKINNKKDINEEIEKWIIFDIEKIIEICKTNRIKILLQDYPANSYFTYNDAFYRVAKSNNIPFVSNYQAFCFLPEKDKYFSPDGHCNAKGYEIMAKNILDKIVQEKIFDF